MIARGYGGLTVFISVALAENFKTAPAGFPSFKTYPVYIKPPTPRQTERTHTHAKTRTVRDRFKSEHTPLYILVYRDIHKLAGTYKNLQAMHSQTATHCAHTQAQADYQL